ncbi:hypothetical protein OCI51_27555 (plasmid) [Lysinibacillus capsici]|uniref:hypothetical protein n=1 Tax=Lysinibacillus capsici TaxID=2115968 RepID=UPI0021D7F4BA|nr:hypothetical protein [Lysinibacillus capsici]UYB50395.1 hypothetical protein OCI51_27555 [Lysinibacillus capsici]
MALEYKQRESDGSMGEQRKVGNGETPGETIERLEKEKQLLTAQNKALGERMEFMEDLIAEIAMKVYE